MDALDFIAKAAFVFALLVVIDDLWTRVDGLASHTAHLGVTTAQEYSSLARRVTELEKKRPPKRQTVRKGGVST